MAGKREMIRPAVLRTWVNQTNLTTHFVRHLREPSAEEGAGARESLHRDFDGAARTAVLVDEYLQPADYLRVVCRKCS